jgi:hypothetical protein
MKNDQPAFTTVDRFLCPRGGKGKASAEQGNSYQSNRQFRNKNDNLDVRAIRFDREN